MCEQLHCSTTQNFRPIRGWALNSDMPVPRKDIVTPCLGTPHACPVFFLCLFPSKRVLSHLEAVHIFLPFLCIEQLCVSPTTACSSSSAVNVVLRIHPYGQCCEVRNMPGNCNPQVANSTVLAIPLHAGSLKQGPQIYPS